MLCVRVRYEDEERRRELKRAGFRWNPQRKLWEGEDTLANSPPERASASWGSAGLGPSA
jgi:hypothetical protein